MSLALSRSASLLAHYGRTQILAYRQVGGRAQQTLAALRRRRPDVRLEDLNRLLGNAWKQLDDGTKQSYRNRAAEMTQQRSSAGETQPRKPRATGGGAWSGGTVKYRQWRACYLRDMHWYLDNGWRVYYLAETSVETRQRVGAVEQRVRLNVCHVGGNEGFLPTGPLLTFESACSDSDSDYDESDGELMRQYLKQRVLPQLGDHSVLVMNYGGFGNVALKPQPTALTRRADMQAWLRDRRVPFSGAGCTNAELYLRYIEPNRCRPDLKQLAVDEMARAAGVRLVRLPPGADYLNAAGAIFEQLRARVEAKGSRRNAQSVVMSQLARISPADWHTACADTQRVVGQQFASTRIAPSNGPPAFAYAPHNDETADTLAPSTTVREILAPTMEQRSRRNVPLPLHFNYHDKPPNTDTYSSDEQITDGSSPQPIAEMGERGQPMTRRRPSGERSSGRDDNKAARPDVSSSECEACEDTAERVVAADGGETEDELLRRMSALLERVERKDRLLRETNRLLQQRMQRDDAQVDDMLKLVDRLSNSTTL